MDDKCNPIKCDTSTDCDKRQCQKEMVEVLHKTIKQDLMRDLNISKSDIKTSYNFSKFLFDFTQIVFAIWLFLTWMAGFVIAKGFWSTFFCIIPFYAWYLVVEAYLNKYGFF